MVCSFLVKYFEFYFKTDLKCVEETKGGFCYEEHLPVLSEKIFKRNSKEVKCEKKPSAQREQKQEEFRLKIKDRVRIGKSIEELKPLQVGHGGWCDEMSECLASSGVITAVDDDNDFEVTYPSGNKWTFNPAVLTLVDTVTGQTSQTEVSSSRVDHVEQASTSHAEASMPLSSADLNNKDTMRKLSLNAQINSTNDLMVRNSESNDRPMGKTDVKQSRRSLLSQVKASLIETKCSNNLNTQNDQLVNNILSTPSENIMTNVNTVKALTTSRSAEKSSFVVNEIVEICSDIEQMRVLQRGHGEWAEAMRPVRFFLFNNNFHFY